MGRRRKLQQGAGDMSLWGMYDRPFLIAGGGIAGFATSLALARIGRHAEVFERAVAFEEEGAGLQMSPNAVLCLRLLDAWDVLEPACISPSEIHIRDGRSGAMLQRIPLGKSFEAEVGAPYRVTHRSDLLRGLVQTAQSRARIRLHTGRIVERAESTKQGARLLFTEGPLADGAAVIGADGIHSTIRDAIVGDNPFYGGQAIYRALLPIEKVPLSIVADCVTLWLYPGGHVVHYAVSNWRSFNIVAVLENSEHPEGWNQPASAAEIANGFAKAANPLTDLLHAVPAWKKFAAADRQPADCWSSGNIALIGDAAHASLPYLAQGAAMALEDAVVLAKCISADSSIAAAMTTYARLRQPRTARIQRESRRLAVIYHVRGLQATARNAVMRFLGPRYSLRRNQWIYDWLP